MKIHVYLHSENEKLDELLRLARQERIRDHDLAKEIHDIAAAVKEPGDSETAKRLLALAARLSSMGKDSAAPAAPV